MVEVKKKSLSVRVHITLDDIANLLDSAGQGSEYWSGDVPYLKYESVVKSILYGTDSEYTSKVCLGGKIQTALKIADDENEPMVHLLTLQKIKKGLTVMAKKERSHFCDLINDNADMVTGDVFLQCCLFGEVLYS